jgi:hypothetical protein
MERASAQHFRRIHWFVQALQTVRIIGAFGTLIVFAWTAVYFINHNAPVPGASIFSFGGISTIVLFLGLNPGRLPALLKAAQALGALNGTGEGASKKATPAQNEGT